MTQLLQRTLSLPLAFDLHQKVVGGGDSKRRFVEEYVQPQATQRVLDIGCGTGALRALMPQGTTYLGVEISPAYVEAARSRFGDASEFVCADLRTFELPAGHKFDLVMAYGVFHHLDDDAARRAVALAATALGERGRLVIAEPCRLPRDQGWLERLLMWLDRGRFIRAVDEYTALIEDRFARITTDVVADSYHVPYTMVIVEAA
jgi:SAM-dependent methyltransferase